MKQSEINALNILNNIQEDSTADLLEKSMGHKYFKREGTPGNYKYYYTEDEYKQAKGKGTEGKGSSETIEKDGKKYKLQPNGKYLEVSEHGMTKEGHSKMFHGNLKASSIEEANKLMRNKKEHNEIASKLSGREFTKEELEGKKKFKLSPQVERVIDALTTVNSKYNEPSKITVEATPKGNWRVYYEGKETGITLGRNQISEDTIRDNQWEHHENNEDDKPNEKISIEAHQEDVKTKESTDSYKNIKGITDLLSKEKIPYKVNDYRKSKELEVIDLCSIVTPKPEPLYDGAHGYMATSLFENEPVYVSITNVFKERPKTKMLFDKLDAIGLKEATGKKNAQWGTWKFAIRSNGDLKKAIKSISDVYKSK